MDVLFPGAHVFVTGAGGFIGSHLVEALAQKGCRVHAFFHYNSQSSLGNLEHSPVREQIEVYFGDIRDTDSIKNAFDKISGIDFFFHLASLISVPYSYQSPTSFVQTNVQGTLNLLRFVQEEFHPIKFVHTSSSEVYGTAQYTPMDEKHPIHPQSPYAATKAAADYLAQSFFYTNQLPIVTIRPFNTFGPRQSTRALIPTIIAQALFSEDVRLGKLTPVRDYTYVDDTVDGFIRVAEQGEPGEVYNVGRGNGLSVGAIARTIIGIARQKVPITYEELRSRPEQSEVMSLVCDSHKVHQQTGWRPLTDFETGIAKTIQWIGQNADRFRKVTYQV